MTSSGKKGKAAVLEFDTQSKGQFILSCVETTLLEAENKWTIDMKHGDTEKIIKIYAAMASGKEYSCKPT